MILVTGGTGLIGSHLLYELTKEENGSITAIYRNENKISTVKKVFEFYNFKNADHQFNKITWIKCDVLDIVALEDEVKKATNVYHCAAIVSFRKKDFAKMMQINRQGTANIVNLCVDHNIEKLIHVSSTAAIGTPPKQEQRPVTEKEKWVNSSKNSGYSVSKYSSENEVWRGVEEGLNAAIVNPSVVFGAGDWNESSLTVLKSIEKGLKFYPPGANAFVDARDVAEIMVRLMNSEIHSERFLLIGENTTFKNMFSTIAEKLNKKTPSIKVSKILMGFAWRIASFWAWVTRKPSAITKETARSAFNTTEFDASKIKKELNYNFYTLDEMISNAVKGKVN